MKVDLAVKVLDWVLLVLGAILIVIGVRDAEHTSSFADNAGPLAFYSAGIFFISLSISVSNSWRAAIAFAAICMGFWFYLFHFLPWLSGSS